MSTSNTCVLAGKMSITEENVIKFANCCIREEWACKSIEEIVDILDGGNPIFILCNFDRESDTWTFGPGYGETFLVDSQTDVKNIFPFLEQDSWLVTIEAEGFGEEEVFIDEPYGLLTIHKFENGVYVTKVGKDALNL